MKLLIVISFLSIFSINSLAASELQLRVDTLFHSLQKLKDENNSNDIVTIFYELKSLCESPFISDECVSLIFDEKALNVVSSVESK